MASPLAAVLARLSLRRDPAGKVAYEAARKGGVKGPENQKPPADTGGGDGGTTDDGQSSIQG